MEGVPCKLKRDDKIFGVWCAENGVYIFGGKVLGEIRHKNSAVSSAVGSCLSSVVTCLPTYLPIYLYRSTLTHDETFESTDL